MNSYQEVIAYLYARLPMFTRDGSSAYKKDLTNTIKFCEALGHPQETFKTVHIAGTNGKGSSSHMLAAVLQQAGYKTGLYTSPHLLDFRERIRLNGAMVDEQFVIDFVNTHFALIEEIQPSFFEVTVAMAFDFFAKQEVDIAIIEVGLGGRLDSTNIIQPLVSLITNIGMDHMNMLGNTIEEITFEKAGIIKAHTPVVISEYNPKTAPIFEKRAQALQSPLTYASKALSVTIRSTETAYLTLEVQPAKGGMQTVDLDLKGTYQAKNIAGVLCTIEQLRNQGFTISQAQVSAALRQVQHLTGLQGRWQTYATDPFIICDTGHNEDGIQEVLKNLAATKFTNLLIVIGAMRDKDLSHMLPLLPKDAQYFFCSPDMPRAMPAEELAQEALTFCLQGQAFPTVKEAIDGAIKEYKKGDLIFVGGSNFVVSELLAMEK